ncbi:MAG: hypothetical protein COB62_01720 [Piscirickettsiaceae bacterium]|nr:MAG: hypothetical protein COB62_01720 [Piscirickettsiaceae bacterium]
MPQNIIDTLDAPLATPISNEEMENLLALQQEILGKVAVNSPLQETLDDLCRAAESMLPNSVASIMLFDKQKESLFVKAAPNMPADGVSALNGLIPGEQSGSCGTAVFENSPQFVCDTHKDARWADSSFQAFALKFAIDACWSMPIRGESTTVIGSFALSSMEKRQPHKFHKKLLETCADIVAIILKREAEENKLSYMAHYDALTGLPNRTLFTERFNHAIAHSKRTKNQLAICFLDLDNFKPVNDNFGHQVGDQLLIEVAKRIQECIRDEDTVSRQGGDEFALLLNDIESPLHVNLTLERIHHALALPYSINNQRHHITASSGITLYPSDDGDIDTLLRHADQAMYQAKLAGKNQILLFNPEHQQRTIKKQRQIDDISQALANEEFTLYYQPKVNMKTGKVFGVEALIRWVHPKKGLIQPLDFLPLIDGHDLEIQLGTWVINEAISQLEKLTEKGLDLEVSINISSAHLQSVTFFERLEKALARHPAINANNIQLEILESSALGDIQAISSIVNRCQEELNINFALDDFGTGYSSLAHLRNITANTIKIDRSFIQHMLENSEDLALVKGIISLAKAFNRNVIAEGVETTEHGIVLMQLGCDDAQGYCIAKPIPAAKIATWIDNYIPNKSWLA